MVLMQMRLIVFALSAASSLTLTAPSSMPTPPQAQEQRSVDAKDEDARSTSKSSDAAREIKTEKPKDAGDLPGVYPTAGFGRGFHGLARDFLGDQEQIWKSPAKLRFSDTEWLVPLSGITSRLFGTDRAFKTHPSQNPSAV